MTFRVSNRYRPIATMLLCIAWLFGGVLGELHHVIEAHVVCAEHGVIEHDVEAATDADADGDADEHGDQCQDDLVPALPVPIPGQAISLAATDTPLPITPLVDGFSARGPPLSFAPKTSPPCLS